MADENTQITTDSAQTSSADTQAAENARAEAEFGAGFDAEARKPPERAQKPGSTPAETPREAKPGPEYVQISKSEWADVLAAAKKTAGYDQQLSKAFGTIGNLQKTINNLRDQAQAPKPRPIEIQKDAFADLARDFPELANSTRGALEKALAGVNTGAVDPAAIRKMLAEHTSERELEVLEDAHPDWRDIVGAVDVTQQMPDANNPFRKWLATKDEQYQRRVNGTDSAAVVMRAINLFQRETTPPRAAARADTARADARSERIRSAVQPRGDGMAPAAGGDDAEAQFAAGFASR